MKGFAINIAKTGNPPTWHMSYGGGNGNSVTVPANQQGDFAYNIVNGGGVTFAAQNPIWIQQGTAKPTGPVVDSQITNVAGGGTTNLTFTDVNQGNPLTLTYSLHFSDGSSIDPIINNGGGTEPPPPPPPPPLGRSYTDIAIYLVIGLIIGFLLASALKWRPRT